MPLHYSYTDCLEDLRNKKYRRGINYSLDALKICSDAIENPHLKLPPVIHIAGTNGKGSTAQLLSTIFQESGYSVGLFTSPHLFSYRERIQLNSDPISEDAFASQYTFLKKEGALFDSLTEFESLTVLSFLHYQKEAPDICIYETGLGGLLDTTNLVNPAVSILTNIDLDHTEILGSTLKKITKDKCGIIKENIPVFTTATQHEEVLEIIKSEAKKKKSPLSIIKAKEALPKPSHLVGEHQKSNLGLAVETAHFFADNGFPAVKEEKIKTAIEKTRLWGRFDRYQYSQKDQSITQELILDGAHNPSSINALVKTIQEHYPQDNISIIMGFKKDKAATEMISSLSKISSDLYYYAFDDSLCLPYEQLPQTIDIKPFSITESWPQSKVIVVTGSLYMLPQFYELLKEKNH